MRSAEEVGIAWLEGPSEYFTLDYFISFKSMRGAEYFHLYLWVYDFNCGIQNLFLIVMP